MNKIRSNYVIKDIILRYVPLKKILLIFKGCRRYKQLLQLYPIVYELYYNIQNDFEPYNEHIENEMLSYIVHFSRLQKHLSDKLLKDFYFNFLLGQKTILAEYDNINFKPLLNYLNSNQYNGTLIIKLSEPKLDLSIRPNIEVTGENISLEIYFNMKWIDRDKQDNIDYIKSFLSDKIKGEETKKHVKKINFGEYINLNEEKYEDFFFEELSLFPNALFNIQSNYFDDNGYWKDLDRFFKLKFIIMDNFENNKNDNEKNGKKRKDNDDNKIINNNGNNNNKNNNNENSYNNNNNIINVVTNNKYANIRSKYKKEKIMNKEKSKEINNNQIKDDDKINNNINNINNDNDNNNIDNNKIINNNNSIIINDNKIIDNDNNNIIMTNDNNIVDNKNGSIDYLNNNNMLINNIDNDNKINIINEDNLDFQEEDNLKKLNKNILSIRQLDNFILDLRKNKISIVNEFINTYTKNKDNIKNIIPSKITFINFIYEKKKEYFGELNNKVDSLIVVQRIYRNTPYPFFISPNLRSLIALKLERINILEENLVSIINNNPLLEIFEIHKNYTGYVFGYNLALALSQLNNIKSIITEFFWYKEYVPNFKTNSLVNRQENEFFKFLTSKSLKYLSFANETNINIHTLNQNLPNLISLSMEYSNIIDNNNNSKEDDILINMNNNINNNVNKNRFSFRNKIIKRRSSSLTEINFIKDFNYSEKDRLFPKLRDLNVVKIDNFDEFFKKMAFFNKIENLFVDYFDAKFFETFVKYGYCLNNLDMLYISPDFNERIRPADSENMVKIIHYFKRLTFLEIGFYCVNEELVNLLYNELTSLPLLQQLEIKVDVSSDENKEILKNKIDQLKTNKYNSEYLTITYTFNDKRFKR